MPYKCCAYGCNNVDGVDKNIKLFRFPLNETTKKNGLMPSREKILKHPNIVDCAVHILTPMILLKIQTD
ncbi:unnamed protein product [Macrosiphum euphorbiae]|uniref:THAP-type domain-containing protein n=1 Tax=Macrosiphum euphorbiae TaxID=13131 RepID=A0AAV0WTS9_9HEMI|nr:unnamed protein product [Macrosiphum euphorbiae]